MNDEQKYEMFTKAKRRGVNLTQEQQQWLMDYCEKKLYEILNQPEVVAVLQRLKNR